MSEQRGSTGPPELQASGHCGVPGAPVSPRPTPTGSDLSTTTPSTGGGGQAFWE